MSAMFQGLSVANVVPVRFLTDPDVLPSGAHYFRGMALGPTGAVLASTQPSAEPTYYICGIPFSAKGVLLVSTASPSGTDAPLGGGGLVTALGKLVINTAAVAAQLFHQGVPFRLNGSLACADVTPLAARAFDSGFNFGFGS